MLKVNNNLENTPVKNVFLRGSLHVNYYCKSLALHKYS